MFLSKGLKVGLEIADAPCAFGMGLDVIHVIEMEDGEDRLNGRCAHISINLECIEYI